MRAAAKVNLDLSVGGLRSDGFHPVQTIFQAVSVYDDLTVTAVEPSSEAVAVRSINQRSVGVASSFDVILEVSGALAAGVPVDETNLAVRAARLLAQRAGIDQKGAHSGVRMLLHKAIPVAGGMAGGSADAAAALVACDALWQTGFHRDQLIELAGELGSDVAFALVGGTAIGSGRGEQLTPVLARGQYHWVLVPSKDGLATPDVYAEFDRLTGSVPAATRGFRRETAGRELVGSEPSVSGAVLQAVLAADAAALGRALRNDLQDAAFSLRPDLQALRELGMGCGALGGIVSGSGPTVAFLVRDHNHALDVSVALAASGSCPVVLRAHGPVSGARVGDFTALRGG